MSKEADKAKTEEPVVVDLAPAVEQLQVQVTELENQLAAALEANASAVEANAALAARLDDIEEALTQLPEMLAAGGDITAALAKKPEADKFDYDAHPEGKYVLAPGKIVGKYLDHPFEDIAFQEGKPQSGNPKADGWLRNQITAGYIVLWTPEVGDEHDAQIKADKLAAEKQAKIDAGE